jgi:hypothetical protein
MIRFIEGYLPVLYSSAIIIAQFIEKGNRKSFGCRRGGGEVHSEKITPQGLSKKGFEKSLSFDTLLTGSWKKQYNDYNCGGMSASAEQVKKRRKLRK